MQDARKTKKQLLAELNTLRQRISLLESFAIKNSHRENLLPQGEPNYQELVQNASSIILIMDTEGKVVFLNRFGQDFFGYADKEIVGRNVVGTIVPHTDSTGHDLAAMIHDIGRNPEKYMNNENENIRRTGERVWIAWTNKAIYNEHDTIASILCIGNDITAHKRMEEEKARSEDMLRTKITELSITNEISEVLLSTRELNDILHIILIGVTAHQALGFDRALLFLLNAENNTLEGAVASGPCSDQECAEARKTLLQECQTLQDLLRSSQVEFAIQDEPINKRVKKTRFSLSEPESIFAQAVYKKQSYNVSHGTCDVLVDRSLINLLGSDTFALVPLIYRERAIGVLIADNILSKKPIDGEDMACLKVFANHASLAIENSRLVQNLEEKIEEHSLAYKELKINRDKLLRYERLSAIGEVSAQMAHELRNPLTAIGGFARRLLKNGHAQELNRSYVDIIVKEIDHLETVLNDMLGFVNPQIPHFSRVNLNTLIQRVHTIFAPDIKEQNVIFEENLQQNLPRFWGDEDQLERVFINIIKNALEAIRGGGIITASTKADQQLVWAEIADTGTGIPDDAMTRIFDPFYTNKTSGTGLGLTLSLQIVSSHGGTIEVRKAEPNGTVFIVKLPLKGQAVH